MRICPVQEKFQKQGYAVLYMVESVDDHAVQQLAGYDGRKLVSMTEESLKLEKDEGEGVVRFKQAKLQLAKSFKTALTSKVQLSDKDAELLVEQVMKDSEGESWILCPR